MLLWRSNKLIRQLISYVLNKLTKIENVVNINIKITL